jgi:hypothetical protein
VILASAAASSSAGVAPHVAHTGRGTDAGGTASDVVLPGASGTSVSRPPSRRPSRPS